MVYQFGNYLPLRNIFVVGDVSSRTRTLDDFKHDEERDVAPWKERSLMVRWVVGSILHGVDPLSYFSFQLVLHDWCN